MWALDNRTPFAAERTWVRDRQGAEVWLVVVKGTFLINPAGTTEVADEQVEVCRLPTYRGEPAKSSLLYDMDLVHTKPTTDILLHGHAYAPQGKPTTQVDVAMVVGNVEKTLRVFGDRRWNVGSLSIGLSNPEPFLKMPITYERAFGGTDQKSDNPKKHSWDRRNPVGTGFAVESSHLAGQCAQTWSTPSRCLLGNNRGLLASDRLREWSPRAELAGTYDEKWEKERSPLLPDDFKEQFYLCAPEDQQARAYLQGGESVELRNLTPGGSLRFDLPQEVLGFRTYFLDGELVHHRAKLHTVILEPDVPRVLMVWHTMLPCHPKVLKLRSTTIVRKTRLKSVGQSRFPRPRRIAVP